MAVWSEAARPINDGIARIEAAIEAELDRMIAQATIGRRGKADLAVFTDPDNLARLEQIVTTTSRQWAADAALNTTLGQQRADALARSAADTALRRAGIAPAAAPLSGGRVGRAGKIAVSDVFDRIPGVLARNVSRTVAESLGRGLPKRTSKRKVAESINAVRVRALTAARTEIMGAYRDTLHAIYRNHPDVDGWVWVSRLSRTTCPICWTRHGSYHRKTEPFASHPACQCIQQPFNLANPPADMPSGLDIFERLDVTEQLRILGEGRFRLWNEGRLPWDAMVDKTRHPVFGAGLRLKPIADAPRRRPGRNRKPELVYTADAFRRARAG